MPAAFSRSLESVRAGDRNRSLLALAIAGLILLIWTAWSFLAQISLYEVSQSARLEVDRTPHRVAAPVAGKVLTVQLSLNAAVEAGDLLASLDAEAEQLKLEEKRARLAGIILQIEPIERELSARQRMVQEAAEAGRLRIDEAKARVKESEAMATLGEAEAERGARLRAGGFVTEAEVVRADAEARARRATAEAQQRAEARADAEERSRGSERVAELSALTRQLRALEAEKLALEAEIKTLLGDIERHQIRAPISGKIGEIFPLRAGSFLDEGDVVATIVPDGELIAVSEFPLAAVGRLRPGLPAKIRLEAFPWTEFGTLRATVKAIGTEAREGRVRVELNVERDDASSIPMQHGLAALVIVEVERTSPAILALRAAGQLFRRPTEGSS